MLMVKMKDRVRFVETDMMGVVHHANYFRWFEMGRVEYMRQAGVLLHDLMSAGYLFPIVDVGCVYKKSAKFDDDIVICTELLELSRVKMKYKYKIKLLLDDSLLAEGFTVNLFTKMDGSVARIPPNFYSRLENFYKQKTGGKQ